MFPVELDRLVGLTKLLEMPVEPPADIVASRLLFAPPDQRRTIVKIYAYLGTRWDKLSSDLQQALRSGKVIWDDTEHWPASKVFFCDSDVMYSRYFGARRCDYRTQSDTDATQFLRNIGVIDEAAYKSDPVKYHVEFLSEIADDYTTQARQLSSEDRALLLLNFDYLGSLPDDARQEARVSLAALPIVPSRDGWLHYPNDIVLVESAQESLLRRFRAENPAVVDDGMGDIASTQGGSNDRDRPSKSVRLTEAAFQFLSDLGVPLLALGEVVTGILESVDEERDEIAFADYLHQLDSVFRRFDRTLARSDRQWVSRAISLDALRCIRVVSCARMRVQYRLTHPSGRQIFAQPSDREKVLFVPGLTSATPTLYLRRRGDKLSLLALAHELERLFFPASNYIRYLEDVLSFRDLAKAARYLTRYKFRDDRGDDAGVWGDDMHAVDIDEFGGEEEDVLIDDIRAEIPSTEDTYTHVEESHQTEQQGNTKDEQYDPGDGVENGQHETDDGGYEQHNTDDGTETESDDSDSAEYETFEDQKPGGYQGTGPYGGAAGGTGGGRRNSRRRSSGGRQQSGRDNGDTSSERHDWEPDVEADIVTPHIRAHQPTHREPRSSNDGGRSVAPSSGHGTSSDPHEPQPHDKLTQAAKNRIGQWGEHYALICLKQELLDKIPGANIYDLINAAGELFGFLVNVDGKKIAEACWHNAGGRDISEAAISH